LTPCQRKRGGRRTISLPKYVREKRLGGVMFWEYPEDIDGMLLNSITKGLGKQ